MSIYDSWLVAKEQASTYRPTLLFKVVFYNSLHATFYCTSANDGTATGRSAGVTWTDGNRYQACVKSQQIGALQSGSTFGLDVFGSMSIELADADMQLFAIESAAGWQGATLTARFTLYDPDTNLFSPDSQIVFQGMCDPATWSHATLRVNAVSNYSLAKSILPPVPIQRSCPWNFPSTGPERNDALNNYFSIFWFCGYSPDQSGGVGNLNGGTPYTTCNKSVQNCQQRGMYSGDSAHHIDAGGKEIARFGGVQWTPTGTWKGKSYTAGKTLTGVNSINEQKWSQYVPITFGQTWVNGVCADVLGDPNSTRAEVICGFGWTGFNSDWISNIPFVVVNGLLTPYATLTSDVLFRWYGYNDGWRSGLATPGALFSGAGDPHGSMIKLVPVVYNQIAPSNAPLNVRVNLKSRPIPVYTAPGVFTLQATDLTAWVVYELIRMLRPDLYAMIDVNSVIQYSHFCEQYIDYTKADGSTGQHRRFGVSLSLEKKISAAQVIEGLKLAGRLMIVPSASGNSFRFQAKMTIEDQQPDPIPGSNQPSDVASYRYLDDPYGAGYGSGFLAYDFDDSNVIRESIELLKDPNANIPVIFTAQIQDEDNSWTPDTVTLAGIDTYNRIQQMNAMTISALGLPNYDQAYRSLRSKQNEMQRGTPSGDGGSERWRFTSTFRIAHLTLGSIVRFANDGLGIAHRYLRIESISPGPDFGQTTVIGRYHDDRFYVDTLYPALTN